MWKLELFEIVRVQDLQKWYIEEHWQEPRGPGTQDFLGRLEMGWTVCVYKMPPDALRVLEKALGGCLFA